MQAMEEKFFQTAPVSSWSSTTAMRIPATHRGRGEWENGQEEIRDEKNVWPQEVGE